VRVRGLGVLQSGIRVEFQTLGLDGIENSHRTWYIKAKMILLENVFCLKTFVLLFTQVP
jgi:hypothetical protein